MLIYDDKLFTASCCSSVTSPWANGSLFLRCPRERIRNRKPRHHCRREGSAPTRPLPPSLTRSDPGVSRAAKTWQEDPVV